MALRHPARGEGLKSAFAKAPRSGCFQWPGAGATVPPVADVLVIGAAERPRIEKGLRTIHACLFIDRRRRSVSTFHEHSSRHAHRNHLQFPWLPLLEALPVWLGDSRSSAHGTRLRAPTSWFTSAKEAALGGLVCVGHCSYSMPSLQRRAESMGVQNQSSIPRIIDWRCTHRGGSEMGIEWKDCRRSLDRRVLSRSTWRSLLSDAFRDGRHQRGSAIIRLRIQTKPRRITFRKRTRLAGPSVGRLVHFFIFRRLVIRGRSAAPFHFVADRGHGCAAPGY